MNKGEDFLKVPRSVNADLMTDEELREKLQKGYDDYKAGKVQDARTAFDEFRKKHERDIVLKNTSISIIQEVQAECTGVAEEIGVKDEKDVQKLVDEVRYGSL